MSILCTREFITSPDGTLKIFKTFYHKLYSTDHEPDHNDIDASIINVDLPTITEKSVVLHRPLTLEEIQKALYAGTTK